MSRTPHMVAHLKVAMPVRSVLLASAAVLALAACHRDAEPPEPAPAPAAAVQAPAAPPVKAAPSTAPAAPRLTAEERRLKLRAEKDGEAEAERAPEYAGASSAATALPSQGDDAPATGEAAAQASPPPPPSSQPPG